MNNLELAELGKTISTLNQLDVVPYINENYEKIDKNSINKIILFCTKRYNIYTRQLKQSILTDLDSITLLSLSDNYPVLEEYISLSHYKNITTLDVLHRIDDYKLISYYEYFNKPIFIDLENCFIQNRIPTEYINKFYKLYQLGVIKFKDKKNTNYTFNDFYNIISDWFTEYPCYQYNILELTVDIEDKFKERYLYYYIDVQIIFLFKNCRKSFNQFFPKHLEIFLEKVLV